MTISPSGEDALFDESVRAIEAEYARLGHSLGWRFIYGPRAVLRGPVDIAFVTLNPGGDVEPAEHPRASCESGIAYLTEQWGNSAPGRSVLQIQVQEMFRLLGAQPIFHESYDSLMLRSALSSLVPFRSASLSSLCSPKESIDFGRQLWAKLLPRLVPRLIIGLGRDVQTEFRSLIPSVLGMRRSAGASYATGWGSYEAELDEYVGNNRRLKFLYLPHLSRFTVFTSVRCDPNMKRIIQIVSKGLEPLSNITD